MFLKSFCKKISSVVLVSFLSGVLPIGTIAQAATCTTTPTGASSDVCYSAKVGSTTLSIPKVVFTEVMSVPLSSVTTGANQGTLSTDLADNLQIMSKYLAQNAPENLDVSPRNLVKTFETLPSNMPMVVGQYDPAGAVLRVDVVKSEKSFDATGTPVLKLQSSSFTPEHGRLWAMSKTYSSPTLRNMASSGPGPNPFAQYEGANTAFNGISFAGVQVAMGHAMRTHGASIGILAVNVHRMDQQVIKGGNALRKKITTITSGYAKPLWYLMTPASIGFRGATSGTVPAGIGASICAVNYGDNAACPEHEIVPAFVAMQDVSGDDFLSPETLVYQSSETKKGFTLLAGILLAGAFSFGASMLFSTAGGGLASSLLTEGIAMAGIPGAGVLSGATAASMSATQIALISGAIDATVYGLGAFAFNGANSLTDFQKSSFVIGNVDDGKMAPSSAAGHEGAALSQLRNFTLGANPVDPTSQLGATKQLFYGACNPSVLGSACSGNKGLLPRADRYKDKNTATVNTSMPDYILRF